MLHLAAAVLPIFMLALLREVGPREPAEDRHEKQRGPQQPGAQGSWGLRLRPPRGVERYGGGVPGPVTGPRRVRREERPQCAQGQARRH